MILTSTVLTDLPMWQTDWKVRSAWCWHALNRAHPIRTGHLRGHARPQIRNVSAVDHWRSVMASNQAKVFGGGALDKGALVVSGRVCLLR